MTLIEAARRCLSIAAMLGVAACATAEPGAEFSATDPHEEFNRKMLNFNLALDRNVLRPTARGYDLGVPALVKHLLGNGFSHLDLPGDFANHLMQGEIDPALETLGRFTINTVLGAGGLLDPATEFGLPRNDTDFGITLGKHGVAEGAYWVLPILGPYTTRDAFGDIVDLAFKPTSYIGVFDSSLVNLVSIPYNVVRAVDARGRDGDLIDELLYESADPYVSLRSIYLQRRRSEVAGEEAGAEALPDIFDNN
ncbi:MAG: MlaA family lipoprotein [Alphaproteobacteria bacterium]